MQGATTGTVLRTDLMEVHEEITFDELNLTADRILPPLPVSDKTAKYPVLPRESVMKVPDVKRAPDGSFSRGEWSWGSNFYDCEMYGHEEVLDTVHATENKKWIDEEEITSGLAINGLVLGRESRVATALLNETTWAGATNLYTLTNEWDDSSNATPKADIDAVFKVLRKKNGLSKKLYSLIMTDDLLDYLVDCDAVRDNLVYTQPVEIMSDDQKLALAKSYLGVKEIITTSALFDGAGLNITADISKFWSNEYMLMAKLSGGGSSFKERCVGRQPAWTAFDQPYGVDEYAEPKTMRRIFRAFEYRGITVNTDYGVLIKNAKTTVGSDNI